MTPIQFDHVAIAVPRIADTPPVLVGILGGVPEWGRPAGAFRWATWTFEEGGRLEILEPMGVDGFLHRFLAAHGPGIHHVTFKVPSLSEACRRAEAHGYAVIGRDDSDPSWKEAFLHPKQALGIVVQLAEAGTAPDRPFATPPGLSDPPPPVRILGLRMRAHSAERALAQWRGILQGGVADEADGALVFRWPGSPMRLLVDVDAAGPEGPVSIEFSSARAVALPEAARSILGATFTRRPDGGNR